MQRLWVALLAALTIGANGQAQIIPLPDLTEAQKAELIGSLTENWMTPEDYVISKFKDRDIVFIGEHHRIKHDVELIHKLIPRLYAAGIYDLGIEFGVDEVQDTVGYLINAPEYDEALARWVMFKSASLWNFVEYEDIYRKAWELNHSLPPGAPRFRVVNLNYRARFDLATENTPRGYPPEVWYRGTDDSVMARHILDDFVKKGRKALIYSGMHHAFTRYRQPRLDDSGNFTGQYSGRMGNIVSDSIPARVFSISLHFPWMQRNPSLAYLSYPVGGVIDAVMREFESSRVGFDVIGTPFATLEDSLTYYSIGYSPFVLADYCDGYIYQGPISEYEGCTVDTLFVTGENFEEAVRFLMNPAARTEARSPATFNEWGREDTNFKKSFGHLQ